MQKLNAQKDPKKEQQNVAMMQFKCSSLNLISKKYGTQKTGSQNDKETAKTKKHHGQEPENIKK